MDREDNGMMPDWDDYEPDWLKQLLDEKGGEETPAVETVPAESEGGIHAAPEPEPEFVREEPEEYGRPGPEVPAPETPAAEPADPELFQFTKEDPAEAVPEPFQFTKEDPAEAVSEPFQFTKEDPAEAVSEPVREPVSAAPERPRAESAGPTGEPGSVRPEEYAPYGVPEPEYDFDYEREAAFTPKKRRHGVSVPVIILIVLLVGGMIFAGWQLGGILLNYHRDRSAYNDLASSAISAMAERDEQTATVTVPDDPMSSARVASQVPISVDWDYLRSVNSDIVGWLYCPNTVINYPVVQNNDHDFYLDHGFDKAPNTSGTLFADRNSVAGIVQSNFIIYGHNMKDKSMFGSFQSYVNESYFVQNPTMYFLTPGGSYRVDLIGAHIVEGTVDNFPSYFENTEAYQAYIDSISTSFFWFNRAALNTDYQLITMSTCTSAEGFTDARLLVHGVMVPIQ